MRTIWKWILPLLVLALGVAAFIGLKSMKEEPKRRPYSETVPVITVQEVSPSRQMVFVESQGVVRPRMISRLSAEVAGVVTWVAPLVAEGALVEAGAELVRIDDADYQAAVAVARAELASRRRELAQEEAEAERAREEWSIIGDGEPSALVLREPQLTAIRAAIEAASAKLAKAERDLDRCTIRAPFSGRIESKVVALGQRVGLGVELLSLQAADRMEVVLPVTLEQLRYLDLPLRGEPVTDGPTVDFTTTIAEAAVSWSGRIVRTRAGVDQATRMVHAIAEVPNLPDAPPLLSGLYLRARIAGRTVDDLVRLPGEALQPGQELFVYLPGETTGLGSLALRRVEVVQRLGDEVLVRGDLHDGDQVLTVRVDGVRDGMPVRVAGAAAETTSDAAAEEDQP